MRPRAYIALLIRTTLGESWKLKSKWPASGPIPSLRLVCTIWRQSMHRAKWARSPLFGHDVRRLFLFRLETIFSAKEASRKHGPAGVPADQDASFHFGEIFSCMIIGNLIHTSTVVVAKEPIMRLGGFPENMRVGEDYDAYLRLCREHSVGLSDVPSIRYQIGMPDKLTSSCYQLEVCAELSPQREAISNE